jgi:NAD+ synthetase
LAFGTIEPTEGEGRPLYNSALVATRGTVLGRARKRLLPTYDVFDEDRYFEPGDRPATLSLPSGKIGLTVCEDAWNDLTWLAYRACGGRSYAQAGGKAPRYHENPVGDVVSQKIDLLVNLSASPFTIPKRHSRSEMFAEMAQLHHVPIAFVNQVGSNDELIFDGRSALYARDGTVIARAAAFAEDVVICDPKGGGAALPDVSSDEEAAYRALVLGTKDYARKCGFRKAVLGLSGGIDSALTATIAADALGPENVVGVAMPSRYSSEGSLLDARRLAGNLGIALREIPIEPMFQAYLAVLGQILAMTDHDRQFPSVGQITYGEAVGALLRKAIAAKASPLWLGREPVPPVRSVLSWDYGCSDARSGSEDIDPVMRAGLSPELDALSATCPSDVTFENVQARIRGTVVMAISNRTGALLLTTGNKSEIGVGYCTLYGDMAGGLAVISDVPKTMVYRLARYVNRERERIPQASIEKPPSAELRPGQTDQDTLPPYELLDRVLERFVEDGADRDAIVAEGIAPEVVDRVISLVQRSEYKRRQAAPGLILTKKAFGVGRRMPIAQKFRE